MFAALPSLSSAFTLSNWIPSSLTSSLTHYLIRRVLSLCFDLPADQRHSAANLDQGAVVLQDLTLDVQAIAARLPPGLPIALRHGRVHKLILSLSQPISWTSSTVDVHIDGGTIEAELLQPSAAASQSGLDESLFFSSEAAQDELAKSVAQSVLQDIANSQRDEEEEQKELRETLDEAAHELPGAFQSQPHPSEQESNSSETQEPQPEQTTLLASALARLLSRISVQVTNLTIQASLPTDDLDPAKPALQLHVDTLSASTESAVDRSRQVSLSGLSAALKLPVPNDSLPPQQQQQPASDTSSRSNSFLSSSEDYGSGDDMAMSMAVADLRESQTGLTFSPQEAERVRESQHLSNIEESVYLSAGEDDDSAADPAEADEPPWSPNPQPAPQPALSASSTGSSSPSEPDNPPGVSEAGPSEAPLNEPEAEPNPTAGWHRFFFQGAEAVHVSIQFASGGFMPTSADVKIGHPVLLLTAQTIDALSLLLPFMSQQNSDQKQQASSKTSAMTLSMKSFTGVLMLRPTLADFEPLAAFWQRPGQHYPSTTEAFLYARVLGLSLHSAEQLLQLSDAMLAEHVPSVGCLPTLTFDPTLGEEYDSASCQKEEESVEAAFPALQAQDWVHLAAQHFQEHGPSNLTHFSKSWKPSQSVKAHHRRSPQGGTPRPSAARVAWGGTATQVDVQPVHVRLDMAMASRVQPLVAFFSSSVDSESSSPARTTKPRPSLRVFCPMVRAEARGLPAVTASSSSTVVRSGILTVDVDTLELTTASEKMSLSFNSALGFFLKSQTSASQMFLQVIPAAVQSPRVSLARKSTQQTTNVAFAIPTIRLLLKKATVDGLSLFADDLTRIDPASDPSRADDRDRLVGSRFFGAKSVYMKSESDDLDLGASASQGSTTSESAQPTFEVAGHVGAVILNAKFDKLDSLASGARHMRIVIADTEAFVRSRTHAKAELALALGCRNLVLEEIDGMRVVEVKTYLSEKNEPLERFKLISTTDASTSVKGSKIELSLKGLNIGYSPDLRWMQDLQVFLKPPKGIFDTAVPTERTRLKLKAVDCSICLVIPNSTNRVMVAVSELSTVTDIISHHLSTLSRGSLTSLAFWVADREDTVNGPQSTQTSMNDSFTTLGYRRLVHLSEAAVDVKVGKGSILPDFDLHIQNPNLTFAPCADSLESLKSVLSAAASVRLNKKSIERHLPAEATSTNAVIDILEHIDEAVFRRASPLESPLDIVSDDVPNNPTFLGEEALSGSFANIQQKAANEHEFEDSPLPGPDGVQMLDASAFVIEDNFLTPARHADELAAKAGACVTRLRVSNASISAQLFDGFDWPDTAQAVQAQARSTRKRLQKIRQLLADGQWDEQQEMMANADNAKLWADLKAGLPPEQSSNEEALLAALNTELHSNSEIEEWEAVPSTAQLPASPKPGHTESIMKSTLRRSSQCLLDLQLHGVQLSFSTFPGDRPTACILDLSADSLDVFDHIKTSTWRMFLTELRVQEGGFARPTNSPMLRLQYAQDRNPVDKAAIESRLKARVSPLRLHADQDAIDFLKRFFAFKPPSDSETASPAPQPAEAFIKCVEILPVKVKLDYKPKRVDYKALREGRTVELMNFFHFEGSDMTLRHVTLSGVTGWDRIGAMLQDIWTPDVKANQLADVVSGITPIRSVVNVGSGLADLVLLPLDQYQRDKRWTRGLQKGFASFSRSTALESLRIGARLATGTQVVLEKAEAVLGARLKGNVTAEALSDELPAATSSTSRYSTQPDTLEEGMRDAYASMRTNLRSTAQTILAVPMEVYENSGSEGSARAVLRAIPIAVLHPAIGASDAMSKALFGLSNQLDPTHELRHDKYK